MLIVAKDYAGPRAVALQMLLNRRRPRGMVLKVDGHYGPRTAESVQAFREEAMRTSGPGNLADGPVWQALLRDANLEIVEAVDISDPMLLEFVVPAVSPWTSPIETGGMSNGVVQVMHDIANRVKDPKKLLLVRFHGHGAPGLAAVSHGKRSIFPGANPFREHTVLSPEVVRQIRPELEKMAPLMGDFGFVELHACKVARGPGGAQLLRDLAGVWNCPVSAAIDSQAAEGKSNFLLTGEVVTAYPGGADLKTWARTRKEARS
jgi:hypothetical protein